jgi:hypothetical protein
MRQANKDNKEHSTLEMTTMIGVIGVGIGIGTREMSRETTITIGTMMIGGVGTDIVGGASTMVGIGMAGIKEIIASILKLKEMMITIGIITSGMTIGGDFTITILDPFLDTTAFTTLNTTTNVMTPILTAEATEDTEGLNVETTE